MLNTLILRDFQRKLPMTDVHCETISSLQLLAKYSCECWTTIYRVSMCECGLKGLAIMPKRTLVLLNKRGINQPARGVRIVWAR